jgi:hypothetical protein
VVQSAAKFLHLLFGLIHGNNLKRTPVKPQRLNPSFPE